MKVAQIYEILNQINKEQKGVTTVLNEDLSNIADLGEEVLNLEELDHYTNALVDKVGKVYFKDKKYEGRAPRIMMEYWEFGAILQKISTKELPEVEANEAWQLQDGTSYDQDIFRQPKVTEKFYKNKTTFSVNISITEEQAKSAFTSAEQMNSFIAMIFNNIENALTVSNDGLIMSTVRTLIAETIYDEYKGGNVAEKSTAKAINLLKLYNDATGKALTADKCLTDKEFLQYASYTISNTLDHMASMSNLFNIGKAPRFTPKNDINFIVLDAYANASSAFLESSTYHKELVALPGYTKISFWQGPGKEFAFDSCSKIDVKTPENHTVQMAGILGVACDREAVAVANHNKRVKTHVNANAEFTNYFYKVDASYFVDTNENAVVFFVA